MIKVSSTEFQNEVGRYIDAAQAEPVVVTSHGREKAVVISPAEYRRLTSPAPGRPPAARLPAPASPGRPRNPVMTALSVVNTSTPIIVNRRELRDAITNPKTKYRAQARLLLNELSESTLAGLVARKFVSWKELHKLAERVGCDSDEKAAFIRRMAGISLA
ncbi:MAG TPA: type II toxin-antitoxin system Phd/YefM family antitoxin [Alphaproteobacteria bacterium]